MLCREGSSGGEAQSVPRVLADRGVSAKGHFTALPPALAPRPMLRPRGNCGDCHGVCLAARVDLAGLQQGDRLGQRCQRCPEPEPAAPWHRGWGPSAARSLGQHQNSSEQPVSQPAPRRKQPLLFLAKRGMCVCCWDVRYPGPVERRGKSQESRRNKEPGQGRGWPWRVTAPSGRDSHGDKGSHGLGSMAVLA